MKTFGMLLAVALLVACTPNTGTNSPAAAPDAMHADVTHASEPAMSDTHANDTSNDTTMQDPMQENDSITMQDSQPAMHDNAMNSPEADK